MYNGLHADTVGGNLAHNDEAGWTNSELEGELSRDEHRRNCNTDQGGAPIRNKERESWITVCMSVIHAIMGTASSAS